MDAQRFDAFSKAVATRLSRRQAVRRLGGGGLAASFLAAVGVARSGATQDDPTPDPDVCRLAFTASVRVGPIGQGERRRELAGELSFTLGPDGEIDDGKLIEADGNELPVVGQAVGRAIHLRIRIDDETLVAIGTAEEDVADCRGPMSGPTTGPRSGDLGDWSAEPVAAGTSSTAVAAAESSTAVTAAAGSGGNGVSGEDNNPPAATPAPTPTPCTRTCPPPFVVDSAACTCVCPDGTIPCRDTCIPTGTCCADADCDPGEVCIDGQCGAPCAVEGTACATGEVCCSGTCDFLLGGTCAPCLGRSCSADATCCGGLNCQNGYCGGCRDRATSCTSSDQCCYSDCASGACLSAAGGRCARNIDCRACYLNGECNGACVGGVCAASCPAGMTSCGGVCVDTGSDPANCGTCGNACPPFQPICDAGSCEAIAI